MIAAREFEVPAPDARLLWLVPGVAMALAIVGAGLASREQPRIAMFAVPVVLAVIALLWVALTRRRVRLHEGTLEVVAGLNSRRVPVADIDLAQARIVDLDEHGELRPGLKTFGTSTPGYHAGHFRMRDGKPAFVLLTGRQRVLLLPVRDGKRLLLSLAQPQALLNALAGQQRHR